MEKQKKRKYVAHQLWTDRSFWCFAYRVRTSDFLSKKECSSNAQKNDLRNGFANTLWKLHVHTI